MIKNREIVLLVPEPSPAYINYRTQSFAAFAGGTLAGASETRAAQERVRMHTMDATWGEEDSTLNQQWHKVLAWSDYLDFRTESEFVAYVAFAERVLREGELCCSEPNPIDCITLIRQQTLSYHRY